LEISLLLSECAEGVLTLLGDLFDSAGEFGMGCIEVRSQRVLRHDNGLSGNSTYVHLCTVERNILVVAVCLAKVSLILASGRVPTLKHRDPCSRILSHATVDGELLEEVRDLLLHTAQASCWPLPISGARLGRIALQTTPFFDAGEPGLHVGKSALNVLMLCT
jgi:hypothetical protein